MKSSHSFRCFPLHKFFAFVLALASVCVFSIVGRAASGTIYMLTSNPEYEAGTRGFAGFLRGQGYTVDVGPGSCDPYLTLNTDAPAVQAARIAQLEAYNLIIVHRSFGSGTLNSDNATGVERGIWNKLKVPILNCNGPAIRNNTWRWHGSLYGGGIVLPKDILIEPPGTQSIVAGLTGSLFNNDRIYGGLGSAFGGTEDGGPNMTILARVNVPAFANPICMAVWDEAPGGATLRPFAAAGGESYYRRRVFFEMHEYRNNALNPDPWLEVTANGRLLFADAVQYAMNGVVTPPPAISNLTPADQTANYVAAGGFSFDATSPLPISDGNIRVKLNGSNVAAGLTFSGPDAMNRHVSYSGLLDNLLYNVEISVSNAAGPRTVLAQFDTFVPGQTFTMGVTDGINYSGTPPAGNYHAFLRVAALSAKELSLYRGVSTIDPLVSVFYVPATASIATYTYAPLTDAVGDLNILRFTGLSATFFLDPVDNVTIKPGDLVFVPAANVPATLRPIFARARPIPNTSTSSPLTTITLDLANRDTEVQFGTVHLKLAGNDVTSSAIINYSIDNTSISYQPATFLKPGSNYVAEVSYTDLAATSRTNSYSFVIRDMPAIPAAYKTALGSGANRGFNIRNHMAYSTGAVFCATADRAELQLEGLFLGANGQPIKNAINNTPFAEPYINTTVINYGSTNLGTKGWYPDDQLFPGSNIIGATNVAFEATAFLELKAGINRFGVKSSDGFRLTAGSSLSKANQTVVIGSFDGPRGEQVPSEGAFLVYEDGLYAFRLLYFKGGSPDVSLEWYSRVTDVEFVNDPINVGDRTLINGLDAGMQTPAPAYRSRTAEPMGPDLTVARVGNTVEISWTSTADYHLQYRTSLGAGSWLPVPVTQVLNGNLHTVTIASPTGTVFYRLQSQ